MTMEQTLKLFVPEDGSELALKSCPFCGCTQIIYEKYKHPAGERWRVWCRDCLAGIDPGFAQTRYAVQQMWNRRANAETA